MTDRVQAIAQRLKDATPGPWYWDRFHEDLYTDDCTTVVSGVSFVRSSDAELIEQSPADIAYLLEQNARLQAVVEAARSMRFYCLGTDASTENMMKQFDEALATLDGAE